MDAKLVAWARAVKARGGGCGEKVPGWGRGLARAAVPPLWLFTDFARLPDPLGAVARLPRGLCGVVLRHDGDPGRAKLARALARACAQRGNMLVVAGDARLARAVGAGLHLRGGRRGRVRPGGRRGTLVTSSAHGVAELRRAAAGGAGLAFLSPAFGTRSHPGAAGLGPVRWALARRRGPRGLMVAALGGIDGSTVRRLRCPRAVGAIGALGGAAVHGP